MPVASATTSSSRIAFQARPIREFARLTAARAATMHEMMIR
jgi:hypothetical protein